MLVVGNAHRKREEDRAFYVGDGHINDIDHVRNQFYRDNTPRVQADGDELEVIRRQFTGIPMTNGRVVTWRGDIATFILENIDL